MQKINIAGQKFSNLTAVSPTDQRSDHRIVWEFLCDCGGLCRATASAVKRGDKTSCGCMTSANRSTHGHSSHPLFQTWGAMLKRCHDPEYVAYPNYGARGITVCWEWRKSFDIFVADMGERPPGMTLDRIDNDAGYSKENCRWASIQTQANNRRSNIVVLYDGTKSTMAQFARNQGEKYKRLKYMHMAGIAEYKGKPITFTTYNQSRADNEL